MKIALLTTDNREAFKDYSSPRPWFGPAPEALLQGFALLPEIQVHVVSCVKRPVAAPEKLAGNIFYHAIQVPRPGWLLSGYQGCIRAVRRCLKSIRPDIVHGQGTEKDCAVTAVYSGFPNVLTIHGNMREIARALKAGPATYHWFTARLETVALRRTAGVFCNSRYTEERVGPLSRQKWCVPNALRLPFFEPRTNRRKDGRPCFLHIGTVCEYKQQLEMLELAWALHRQGIDFEICFVGLASRSSPYSRRFLEHLRAAHQQGFARHLDTQPIGEVIRLMDQASGLVHTPTEESFGLVVAEALARNLKFFGFATGGVPDIVEGLKDAVLVEPGNWAALGGAMASWLNTGMPPPFPAAAIMQHRYHPLVIAQRHRQIYEQTLAAACNPATRQEKLAGLNTA